MKSKKQTLKEIRNELSSLQTQYEKLTKYIDSNEINRISDTHRNIVQQQHDAMKKYATCLDLRIEMLDKELFVEWIYENGKK